MTNYRAAMHIIDKGLNGRGTRGGAPDVQALRAEPFSSTEGVLAEVAAVLCDMRVGFRSAMDRLDARQWRILREALAILQAPEHTGAPSTCRWCKGPAWPDQDGACRPCRELELQVRTNPEGAREILDAIRRGQ